MIHANDTPAFVARGQSIWRLPTTTVNDDGTCNTTLGFKVCDLADHLNDGAAEQIAAMLNAGHRALFEGGTE